MWSTGKPQQHWPKYVKTSETIKQKGKSKHMADRQLKKCKTRKAFFPPCRSCFFHTWGGFFMDAGYISLRLEAVSLQTAHQDEWQLWGRELDQLRRRRPGLTIHFLPQSENLHIVATTQKSLARKGKVGKKSYRLLGRKMLLWFSSYSRVCNINFDLWIHYWHILYRNQLHLIESVAVINGFG